MNNFKSKFYFYLRNTKQFDKIQIFSKINYIWSFNMLRFVFLFLWYILYLQFKFRLNFFVSKYSITQKTF